MLDETTETPTADQATETEQKAPATRTRRRAAGRPAGPPAAVSTDLFAAPGSVPPRVEAPVTDDEVEEPAAEPEAEVETTVVEKPKTPQKSRPAAAIGVTFQQPDTSLLPALPARDEGDDSDEDDDVDAAEDAGDGTPKRRRRSRGGRRRTNNGGNRPDGPDGETDESNDGETESDSAESDDESGDGSGEGSASTRRRRRRARAGQDANLSPDDPENTVVKVREGRSAEDEIASVAGSTRLEAKKQRRREGREAGRRRAPIVSEAEFLARRESVKREMIVRQRDEYTQIAVLEDDVLVEHYVARESQTSMIGNVYLGKVQNVLPSMEAAFVDIGAGRNAVLYAGEVDWSTLGNGKARKIEDALSPGQAILVQVTKDPVGQKGARLTSQVSLPGRFLVLVPNGQTSGISRKLPENERARLKSLLKEVLPDDAGVIVRTAAEGATEEQLTRDVSALTARWDDIQKKVGEGKAPQMLYGEPDLVIKVVRDLFNEDFNALIVQGADAWDNIRGYVNHVAPDLAERLSRWEPAEDAEPDVFVSFRIEEQIHKALDRKVWLPSGGSLVIDRTEAMTVVDVNTGKFTGSGGNLEETVTKNNLEAAEEVVRQLRLRDIGGIIVIDFIDMVLESNRDLVLRRLVECLGRDRTRHQVAEVTSLGLVQMTRKRIGTGLVETFSAECDHCNGRGVVITSEPVEPKRDDQPRGRGRRGGRNAGRTGATGGNGNGNGNGGNSHGNGQNNADQSEATGPGEPAAEVVEAATPEVVEEPTTPVVEAPVEIEAAVEAPIEPEAVAPVTELDTPVLTEGDPTP